MPRRKPITIDARTGRPLGEATAVTDTGDLTSYALDTSLPVSNQYGPVTSATPLAPSAGPLGFPWWVWVMLGLGAGYLLARNYGRHISRGLSLASSLTAPR